MVYGIADERAVTLRWNSSLRVKSALPYIYGSLSTCGLMKGSVLVRILVADDNPVVRHYLRGLLEQQTTWRVCDEARTGGEALERVRNNRPDVILLDFQMPELNGLDIARQISRLFPDIPILMVTVHFSRQLAVVARSVGIRGACARLEVASIVEGVDALLGQETYFPEIGTICV